MKTITMKTQTDTANSPEEALQKVQSMIGQYDMNETVIHVSIHPIIDHQKVTNWESHFEIPKEYQVVLQIRTQE